jgi:hypothetical protein
MRTTVQLRDDQREALAALAARKGLRGFSELVQEAVDSYLREQAAASADPLLALEGTWTDAQAAEARARIDQLWRSWDS